MNENNDKSTLVLINFIGKIQKKPIKNIFIQFRDKGCELEECLIALNKKIRIENKFLEILKRNKNLKIEYYE